MSTSHATVKRIMRSVLVTRPQEIGCDDVYPHLDRFAERWLAHEDPAQEMPLIWHHLRHCRFCREELGALIRVIDSPGVGEPDI